MYDGPFCVLSIVDNRAFKRLCYEVLDHPPAHGDIRAFFQRFQVALANRGLTLRGITTDGSDDDQRHWAGNSAENLGWIRKLALCLLKAEKSRSSKGKSIATRRLIAGWKNDYLLTVLAQITEKSGA